MKTASYLRDFNMAAFWAGITGFVWYAFGTIPLHIAVSGQLGLTTAQSSSWMFIVWFSGAVASIGLSLRYRQPIPITWTIPGLVSDGSLQGRIPPARAETRRRPGSALGRTGREDAPSWPGDCTIRPRVSKLFLDRLVSSRLSFSNVIAVTQPLSTHPPLFPREQPILGHCGMLPSGRDGRGRHSWL
jgi:hypothetical protein